MLPIRLVLIQLKNNCMFWSSPTGESFTYEVEHLLGYISCEKCKIICKQTADNFINTSLFGKVQHLKNKN